MKPNAQIDEKVIIRKCKNNDRQFQKILFERYYGKLMGICMRYSKDKFQAQDY